MEPSFTGGSLITVAAPFQVVVNPVAPAVSLTVGTVYFPGDSAVVSILVTSGGIPVSSSGLQLSLTLTRPNSSPIILPTKPVGGGIFRASYLVPKNATIGTYTLVATAHMPAMGDGSALGSFEVRLPWLSSGTQTAAATIGITSLALVGVALVSWRQGYFRKSSKEKF
jgi:hypothetical protein